MGLSGVGCIDVATSRKDFMKQLGGISPGFFSQIITEKYVSGTLDQILNDPFPTVVCECNPINLRLSVPFPKRNCSWFPDKDEIALCGGQHHIIPIDHKHMAGMITDQIGWM